MMSTATTAPKDFTVENIVSVLECVPTAGSAEHSTIWRYLPHDWKRPEWVATGVLNIPYWKFVKITRVCSTDDEELRAVVRFWLVMCLYASWRWLIWQLDGWCQFELADQIREYAEPLEDPTLTFENVCAVVSTANRRFHLDAIEYCLTIPMNKRKTMVPLSWWAPGRLKEYDEYRDSLVRYWMSCSPFASWEYLAGQLCRCKEDWALDLLKTGWQRLPDPSLTVKNFWKYHKELTKMLSRGSKFSEWFNITNVEFPNSLLYMNSASIAYTAERHILKLAKDFTNHHPAPSWKQAAYAMYMTGLYCIVGDIQMQYIDKDTGFSLQKQCINKIASVLKNPEHVCSLPLPARTQSCIIHCIIIMNNH